MQSQATSVAAYLKSLPEDRRQALEAVRKVVLAHLDKDFEEGMQYGMIGYYVPHRIYPAGYHCDPKQPLPYAALASQKAHMSIYLNCLYTSPEDTAWFQAAWKAAGKKLDAGKSCVRFKKLEDLALDVIGEAVGRVTAKQFVARYEASRAEAPSKSQKKAPTKAAKKSQGR